MMKAAHGITKMSHVSEPRVLSEHHLLMRS